MGQADCRGTDVHNHGQVFIVVGLAQCATLSPAVLMARHAVHGISFAIEPDAFSWFYFNVSQSERLHTLVCHLPVLEDAHGHLI